MSTPLDQSNFSYAGNQYWVDGLLDKPIFDLPLALVFLYNTKRIFVKNQTKANSIVQQKVNDFFAELGIDKTIELLDYHEDSVHLGATVPDPNSRSVYIQIRTNSNTQQSNAITQEIEIRIAMTTGPQDKFDDTYLLSMSYIAATQVTFITMFNTCPNELQFGWNKRRYCKIINDNEADKPQVIIANGDLSGFPELIIKFKIVAGINTSSRRPE